MYEEKLGSVRTLLEKHNVAVNGGFGTVDVDKFFSVLSAVGCTNDAALSRLSHEDIIQYLDPCIKKGEINLPPKPLAAQIADIFRGKLAEPVYSGPLVVTAKKASKMTLAELISSFDPEEYSNEVGKRLKDLFGQKAFIVYLVGNVLNVAKTLQLAEELKKGYTPRRDIEIDGVIKKVHQIGEIPDNFVDENPLYPKRALRPDGTCDQTGRSWDGIPQETRQLIRLAMEVGELTVTYDAAHDIIDSALESGSFVKLSKRYRKAALLFEERKNLGNLPRLKVSLNAGSEAASNRATTGFPEGKKVEIVNSHNHPFRVIGNKTYYEIRENGLSKWIEYGQKPEAGNWYRY